jgi:hypothetical protein
LFLSSSAYVSLIIGCDSYFFRLANVLHQNEPNPPSLPKLLFQYITVKYILNPFSTYWVFCWHHRLGSINQLKRGILSGYIVCCLICP